MANNMVAFGLVAGMDYGPNNLDVHGLLQKLKRHHPFSYYLEGGELMEWGAKTIPEGGYHALPETFVGDGLMLAAETAFEALMKKDTSAT